jgi:hypothetical protein
MNKEIIEKDFFAKIIGKEVTKTIAGGSNGSTIILEIGHNEYCLFIYCVWRLELDYKALTGWNESSNPDNGNLTKQIRSLASDRIKDIQMSDFFDLRVKFESGKVLTIFCDVTPKYEPDDYDENWSICDIKSDQCYIISRDFEVESSKFK